MIGDRAWEVTMGRPFRLGIGSHVIEAALVVAALVCSPQPAGLHAAEDQPLQVGGNVLAPELVERVEPVYPEAARRQRVFGNVILEGVIDTEGKVESVAVLRSIPLLDESAVEAVRQYKYKPATRDGRPVRVVITILVSFPETSADAPAAPGSPGSAADRPLEVTGNVQPPVLVSKVAPVYSKEARRAGVQGTVILRATIDAEGNVASVAVARSVPMLDDAAVKAVKQWKYTPARKDGRPVEVVLTVSLNFTQ